MTTRQTPDAVRKLHVALLDCPHCGSRPERRTRRKQKVVRCHAGSHLLEAIADSQREADDIWNTMAADWARKNTREGQAVTSIQVLNAIANIQHIAGVVVNGSLNTHAHQLRECARILSAALDSRAGDAGEGFGAVLDRWDSVIPLSHDERNKLIAELTAATPAPAVDAVPAGEGERLARIRTSMALLQQNSEGCALNHYGDEAAIDGMPSWLIDTKADLDALTNILARREARL